MKNLMETLTKTKVQPHVGIVVGFLVTCSIVVGIGFASTLDSLAAASSARQLKSRVTVKPMTERSSSLYRKFVKLGEKNYLVTNNWAPKSNREPLRSGKKMFRIYPFSIVKGVNPPLTKQYADFTAKNKDWQHAGIKGMGVIRSVDYDRQTETHLLISADSGLYRSYSFGNAWDKLNPPAPVNIEYVRINPTNPKHYVILYKDYAQKKVLVSDLKTTNTDIYNSIYQSYNSGKTWKKLEINDLLDSKTKTIGYLDKVYHINFVGNELNILGRFAYNNIIENTDNSDLASISINNNELKSFVVHNDLIPSFENPYADNSFKKPNLFKINDTGYGLMSDMIELHMTSDSGKYWKKIFNVQNNFPGAKIRAFDISNNGKIIYLVLKTSKAGEVYNTIAKSTNGGLLWDIIKIDKYIEKSPGYYNEWDSKNFSSLWSQDLTIDPQNSDHIYLFQYMRGLFESYDSGVTWTKDTQLYSKMSYVLNPDSELMMINPGDLRIDKMHVINVGSKGQYLLMPGDQGLFAYGNKKSILRNLVSDLYLGDTRGVSITSCPRIYAGLWHHGSYWLDKDGSVHGLNSGESRGYGIGEDLGCETPAFDPHGSYLYDGMHIDYEKTDWILNQIKFESIPFAPPLFTYADGWWYFLGKVNMDPSSYEGVDSTFIPLDIKFIRVNKDFTQTEILADDSVVAYFVEESTTGNQPTIIWKTNGKMIDRSTDGQNWEKVSELPEAAYIRRIYVGDQTIYIAENSGFMYSHDGGATWKKSLDGYSLLDIEVDSCGTIYTNVRLPLYLENKGGVYYSKDGGATFNNLGKLDDKLIIEDLDIDEVNNVLYAATFGESLVKIGLEQCS